MENKANKGPSKRLQHLLQDAFNTLLNQMSGEGGGGGGEQVEQHCWKCKKAFSRWYSLDLSKLDMSVRSLPNAF